MTAPPNPTTAVQALERQTFARYRDGLIHSWLVTLTALGFSLVPLFIILDYFTMPPELLGRFAKYRIAATVAVLAQFFIIRRTKPSPYSYLHGYAFTILVGGMIVKMTHDLGGFDSSYYAGLILVVVAVNLLLPWRAVHSAVNGLIILGMYITVNAAFGGPFKAASLINNLYFLGSTVIIAVAINFTKHQLIQKEFQLREELLDVNHSLDRSRQELKAARDALWGEMEVAKRIQTALLPKNRELGPFQVSALMRPAAEVGGDYYDLIETAAGERWVAIGDVSGHGVESGLVMMMTQTSILSTVMQRPGLQPSEVFCAINGAVRSNIERLATNRYMTLNVIRLTERGLVVSGKHQDFLVYRKATRKVEIVSNEGCWLGMLADTTGHVENQELPLEVGDVVLLFTDGVTEAANRDGDMFGDVRLAEALAKVGDRALDEALNAVLEAVLGFQHEQADDITLLLLRKTA